VYKSIFELFEQLCAYVLLKFRKSAQYLEVLWSEVVGEMAQYVGGEGGETDSETEPQQAPTKCYPVTPKSANHRVKRESS
jgi:hypothetical protein